MPMRRLKLEIWNDKGEKLTFESAFLGKKSKPSDLAKLLAGFASQAGQAMTVHKGFIEDWEEKEN